MYDIDTLERMKIKKNGGIWSYELTPLNFKTRKDYLSSLEVAQKAQGSFYYGEMEEGEEEGGGRRRRR